MSVSIFWNRSASAALTALTTRSRYPGAETAKLPARAGSLIAAPEAALRPVQGARPAGRRSWTAG
jgi:hypothetical protein